MSSYDPLLVRERAASYDEENQVSQSMLPLPKTMADVTAYAETYRSEKYSATIDYIAVLILSILMLLFIAGKELYLKPVHEFSSLLSSSNDY